MSSLSVLGSMGCLHNFHICHKLPVDILLSAMLLLVDPGCESDLPCRRCRRFGFVVSVLGSMGCLHNFHICHKLPVDILLLASLPLVDPGCESDLPLWISYLFVWLSVLGSMGCLHNFHICHKLPVDISTLSYAAASGSGVWKRFAFIQKLQIKYNVVVGPGINGLSSQLSHLP